MDLLSNSQIFMNYRLIFSPILRVSRCLFANRIFPKSLLDFWEDPFFKTRNLANPRLLVFL